MTEPISEEKQFEPLAFRPRLDWWVAILVGFLLLTLISSVPMLFWAGSMSWVISLGASVLLVLFGLYVIDMAFYSLYILDDSELIILSHLRRHHFKYKDMATLRVGGFLALFSRNSHKRFALSRKNVIIKLAQGQWKSISLSPEHQDEFIEEMVSRIDAERADRAARQHGTKRPHAHTKSDSTSSKRETT